jgi:hypothetical protein
MVDGIVMDIIESCPEVIVITHIPFRGTAPDLATARAFFSIPREREATMHFA